MDFGDFMAAPPAAASASASADVELDRKLYTMLEIEQRRYEGFFAALDESRAGTLPRAAVLAFYAKSALSEQEVADMYALIKSLQLLADPDAMDQTEFTTGMHFIVCMTKRSLAKLPRTFPKYLFPTLDLTPQRSAFAISSMPSPDKDEMQQSGTSGRMSGFSGFESSVGSGEANSRALSEMIEKLQASTTLQQLVEKETHNKRAETSLLQKVQQSESSTLQSLRACLDLIAASVEKIGYPVPPTARAVDALDDFSNLLRSHVQATKQEIQSLEISAQMLSVASEVSGDRSSNSALDGGLEDADPFREIAQLTQQLSALQTQAAQLYEQKEKLQQQLNEKKRNAMQSSSSSQQQSQPQPQVQVHTTVASMTFDSPTAAPASMASASPAAHTSVLSSPSTSAAGGGDWGDFGSSTTQEVRNSESVDPTKDDDPFALSASPSAAPVAPAAEPSSDSSDFSWGHFS